MPQEISSGAQTGWKAARESRRPGKKRQLKEHPPSLKPSRKRRVQAKNRKAAMRARGIL